MPDHAAASAIARLRAAADAVQAAFPDIHWTRVSGPGPDAMKVDSGGGLHGFQPCPGDDVVVRSAMELPASVHGVPIVRDELQCILFTIFPTILRRGGEVIFQEAGGQVAAGPALIQIVPSIREGSNGDFELRIALPENQTTAWFNMRFTTPGLRARFELLDVAYARMWLASEVAVSAEQTACVARAAARVPEVFPLEEEPLAALCAAIAQDLAPLADAIADLRVHLVGHSHIDMNWLWTWPDTIQTVLRDFRSVVALMDEFPELTFSHSQAPTYEIARTHDPALFERVRGHIAAGRWEPISMQWVEGDANMASGEGMARQLLEGVSYTREVLGAETTTMHAPDTFGHPGNLPQMVVSAGALRYYHHRCNPGQEDLWPAYWWEGDDGTRVLGISTHTYNGDILARDLALTAIRARKHGQPVSLHFHGIGDHGGGPSRQNLLALRRFQGMAGLPTAFCSTLASYTDAVVQCGATLPVHRGEMNAIFEGCYTTHADTKLYNRSGENLLSTADTLAALAGIDRVEELTEAWRAILFHQFHDILDGSAIHESYIQNREDYEAVCQTAATVTEEALGILQAGAGAGNIAVTNPLGWEREDWVSVPGLTAAGAVRLVGDHGHETVGQAGEGGLGFVARVPAYGTVSYRLDGPMDVADPMGIAPACSPVEDRVIEGPIEGSDARYIRIDTPAYCAYVRRDCGIIVGFHDRAAGRQLVGFGMRRGSDYQDAARPDLALNVLQLTQEAPHGMASWQVNEVHTEHSLLSGATTTVVEAGPVRCVLEVVHRVRASVITQRVAFYRDLARVDFDLHLDWQEPGNAEVGIPALKAAFTARLPQSEAWFETPFGATRRPSDGQEVVGLRWADVGGPEYGLAVLNDSKYGHDAMGGRLRLTLVRSAYDPDAISDIGEHRVRYAMLPHAGSWADAGVVRAATGFNQPLVVRIAQPRPVAGTACGVRPALRGLGSVVPACVKVARDRQGVIVRLYESAGRSGEVVLSGFAAGASVCETNLVEDALAALVNEGGSVRLAFRPWQVRTVRIGS